MPKTNKSLNLPRGNLNIPLERETNIFTALATTHVQLQSLQSTAGIDSVSRISGYIFKAKVNSRDRDLVMNKFRERNKGICHHAYKPKGANSTRYYLTDQLITQFDQDATPSTIQDLCSEYGLNPLRELPGSNKTYVLQVSSRAGKNPLKIANEINSESFIKFCEPDLIERVYPAGIPTDPGFQLQWYLRSWEADDVIQNADISIMDAWEISTGTREVVVAVIDDGFELSHPDFAGEDKIVHPLDFVDGDTDPNPDRILGDYHGTPCAGIAIAEQNGLGVVGSAPGCAFMPVRTNFQQKDSDWWNVFHKVSQHASVISCSWGPPPVWAPLSTALKEKFTQISTNGGPRGKGCLIVFAAHNYNAPINNLNESGFQWRYVNDPLGEFRHTSEPILNGMAAHPDTLTVSASTSLGKKAIYSNWGSEVSVCAPSSNGHPLNPSHPSPGLGIWTTDNELESPGFKTGSQFTGSFGGTSSAAPLVAGVAGLIFSSNPDLSAQDVRSIIQKSADKIEDHTLDPMHGHNKGTYNAKGHSEWFGYGKINASNALKLSLEYESTNNTNTLELLEQDLQGQPRIQYRRIYLLLPQESQTEWIQSIISTDIWLKERWTVGFSADDAGIGNLSERLIIAINPDTWGANMLNWYQENYPGAIYHPMSFDTPNQLANYLETKAPSDINTKFAEQNQTNSSMNNDLLFKRGLPRTQYERSYLLMPPSSSPAYTQAIVDSQILKNYRLTVGFSADDAGIGNLSKKSVTIINPHEWGDNITEWYSLHYPGSEIKLQTVSTPRQLREFLANLH